MTHSPNSSRPNASCHISRRGSNLLMGLFSTVLLISCVSDPPPLPKLEIKSAEQAITNAEKNRVAAFAPLEMKVAHDKLSLAKDAVQDENMPAAKRLAEQSRVIAELAIAKSEAIKAKEANDEITKSIENLREEMQRQPGGQQ